jgi:hypothetical protein
MTKPAFLRRPAAGLALAAVFALPAGALAAPRLPADARIVYDVLYGSGGFRIGRAEQHWQLNGGRYELTTDLLPVIGPHIRYVSKGRVTEAGLVPESFGEFRDDDQAPRVRAEFDWTAKQVLFGRADEHKTAPLQPGAQDVNALAYQISWGGGTPVRVPMQVATGKSIAEHVFTAGKPARTSVGTQSTTAIPYADGTSDQRTEVWIAPKLADLPVRVVRVEDGRELQFVARDVHYSGGSDAAP